MADQPKPKQPTKIVGPTHWDPETGSQEVPTLTSLMNRKKLDVSKGSNPSTQTSKSAAKSPAPGDITVAGTTNASRQLEFETNQLKTNAYIPRLAKPAPVNSASVSASPQKPSTPAAVPERRLSRPQLNYWTPDSLKAGPEAHEKALMKLLPKGLGAALYLQADQRAPVNRTLPPLFVARTAFGSRQQLAVWNGLRWDPAQFQALWNELFSAGYLELAAQSAGIPSPTPSPKAFLRSAFGADPSEILTF